MQFPAEILARKRHRKRDCQNDQTADRYGRCFDVFVDDRKTDQLTEIDRHAHFSEPIDPVFIKNRVPSGLSRKGQHDRDGKKDQHVRLIAGGIARERIDDGQHKAKNLQNGKDCLRRFGMCVAVDKTGQIKKTHAERDFGNRAEHAGIAEAQPTGMVGKGSVIILHHPQNPKRPQRGDHVRKHRVKAERDRIEQQYRDQHRRNEPLDNVYIRISKTEFLQKEKLGNAVKKELQYIVNAPPDFAREHPNDDQDGKTDYVIREDRHIFSNEITKRLAAEINRRIHAGCDPPAFGENRFSHQKSGN